jgi:hypothetical protein
MSGTAWSKVVVNAREQPRKKILLKSPLIRDRIQHGPRTARLAYDLPGAPGEGLGWISRYGNAQQGNLPRVK